MKKVIMLLAMVVMVVSSNPVLIAQKDDFGDPTGTKYLSINDSQIQFIIVEDEGWFLVVHGYMGIIDKGEYIDVRVRDDNKIVHTFSMKITGQSYNYSVYGTSEMTEMIEMMKVNNQLTVVIKDYDDIPHIFNISCSGFTTTYTEMITHNKLN